MLLEVANPVPTRFPRRQDIERVNVSNRAYWPACPLAEIAILALSLADEDGRDRRATGQPIAATRGDWTTIDRT